MNLNLSQKLIYKAGTIDSLLCVLDHRLDLVRRQSTDRVLDRDLSLAARSTILGRDFKKTIGIHLKGTDKLGLTTGHWWDTRKLKLSKKPVVLALSSLTLVYGEHDGGLIVLDSGENSRFVRWNRGVSGKHNTENVALHGNTEGKRSNVEEEKVGSLVRGLTGQNSSLNSGTVGNSLIGVDGFVELTATEELGNKRLDLGDTGRTTNKNNVINFCARDLGVFEDLVDGVNRRLEGDGVDLLKSGTGDVGRKVCTLVKRVDFDCGLRNRRESSLGTFTGRSQTTHSAWIVGDVELALALELGLEVLKEGVVKVLTTKMGVTSGGLDGKHFALYGQKGDIECTTTQVENKDIALVLGFLVKAVRNSGSSGLVDDTEDLETSNGTSILGSKTLRVVEVGRDAKQSVSEALTVYSRNNSLLDSLAEFGL